MATRPALGQQTREDEQNLIHWAFANQLGSGMYKFKKDNGLYILRLNPRFHLDLTPGKPDFDQHILLEFSLPVSFGVHRFRLDDSNKKEIPNHMHQYGLAVTSGLEIPVSSIWRIRSLFHLGWGALLDEFQEKAWIYGGDFFSRLQIGIGSSSFYIINNLGWYGHSSNRDATEDIILLMNAVETRFPLGKLTFMKQPLYLKLHVANFFFLKGIGYFFHPEKEPVSIQPKWELGLAVGTKKPMKFAVFKLDRMGIAVYYGGSHWGVKIFFNSLFYK